MELVRSSHMPYCIQRLEDGRYIVLNRHYKPLGETTREWVTYETHPTACALQITARQAAQIDWDGRDSLDRIYLYNDGCIPTESEAHTKAYLDRLAVLMNLKIKPPR